MYDLTVGRKRRAHALPQSRPESEEKSRTLEAQLRRTEEALARAHESLVQIALQIERERSGRLEAEQRAGDDRQACHEAMRMLGETVQSIRAMKAHAAEHEARAAEQVQERAELEAKCIALEAELSEAAEARAGALELAEQFRTQLETERRLRVEAEAKAHAELLAQQETALALVDAKTTIAELRELAAEHARLYADVESRHRALEARMLEIDAARERSAELAEQVALELGIERRTREEAESRIEAETHAHECTREALRELERAAEDHAHARAELEVRRRSMEGESGELAEALARAEYEADCSAHRTAELEAALETERRTRAQLEAELEAKRAACEQPQANASTDDLSSGFFRKLRGARR
jgi:hypothetical protein